MSSTHKERLLLHICCGPCATHVIDVLRDQFEIIGFFCNPNIEPADEYTLRLKDAQRVCDIYGVALIEAPYSNEDWRTAVHGLENEPEGGKRCNVCFAYRLEATARCALENACDVFTTTLTISPHKNAKRINEIGKRIADEYHLAFLDRDFKKKDGFKRSVELSKKFGLRRQTYCGCLFSLRSRATHPSRA